MAFKEVMQKLSLQIQERKAHIDNEEATKHSLVIPFIQSLGYDIYNPLEIKPEYVADFAMKKGEKVDYAIYKNNKPIMFIEAKAVNQILENHDTQLCRYFNSTPVVKFGILTNGIRYKFFTDLKQNNIMDSSPFYELSFDNLKDEDAEILGNFSKDNFDSDKIIQIAEEMAYTSNLMKNMKELFTNPTDEFIRYLIKDFSDSRITSVVVEKFRPLVKKALAHTILDIVKEGMQLGGNRITPDCISTSKLPTLTIIPEKVISTTSEELNAFELVKSILSDASKDISQIKSKDTASYFSILNRNVHGWFLRIFLDRSPKFVMLRIPYKVSQIIPCELDVIPLGNERNESKVFLNSIDDLTKVKRLIIKSFELVQNT